MKVNEPTMEEDIKYCNQYIIKFDAYYFNDKRLFSVDCIRGRVITNYLDLQQENARLREGLAFISNQLKNKDNDEKDKLARICAIVRCTEALKKGE